MRRAVVLMPNGLTLINLMCGIYAIILALNGRFADAPLYIVLGGIADTLDGRVARATGTGSRFGEELDSLVDAISFGFAPALIVYSATPLDVRGNLDWLLVFIFSACAVMRLARFNVEQAGRKKTHFHGLPSPAAGLTLASYYWFAQTPLYKETVILFTDSTTLAQLPWHNLLRALMAVLAALMISDVPYPAVPSIGFNSVKRILGTLAVAGSVVLLLLKREEFIFPAMVAYVLYGVVKWMLLGFLGRSSTPDEIFWEREAELHQEDEDRDIFDRPALAAADALQDIDDQADEERERPLRSRRDEARREERREGRRDELRKKRRGERTREKPRRDDAKREDSKRDDAKRDDAKRDEPRRERSEPRRTEPRPDPRPESRPETPRIASPILEVPSPETDTDELSDDDAREERREPGRGPDDEVQRRKRRRRRGRGRGERGPRPDRPDASQGGEPSGESSGESSSGSSSSGSSSGGEPSAPPPPPPPPSDTFNPSGPTE